MSDLFLIIGGAVVDPRTKREFTPSAIATAIATATSRASSTQSDLDAATTLLTTYTTALGTARTNAASAKTAAAAALATLAALASDLDLAARTVGAVIASGAGALVAVGNHGAIISSSDGGATWTQRDSTTSDDFTRVHFVGERFYAVTSSGATYVSFDGLRWKYNGIPTAPSPIPTTSSATPELVDAARNGPALASRGVSFGNDQVVNAHAGRVAAQGAAITNATTAHTTAAADLTTLQTEQTRIFTALGIDVP